jgi:trimethylamine--corrinoid protein Co-methyltransferase
MILARQTVLKPERAFFQGGLIKESIMQLSGLPGGLYKPLSSDDIATIHEASLKILENIGMTYEGGLDETLDLLENRGVRLDRAKSRIFFDRNLVAAQVALAPEQVLLYSRDGNNDLDLT